MTRQEFLQIFPELAKNYRPAPDVLQKISNLRLLMIIGPSGVGKTTVMQHLGLPYIASDTTRPRRPEEAEGIDYNFRTDYGRIIDEIKNGRFVQVAIGPDGDFYSTKDTSYPASGTAVIAVVADVVPIFRQLGFKETISTFITPPSYAEWMRRLGSHELPDEQLAKRLVEARRSLEFALDDSQTHLIFTDELGAAVQQIRQLLSGTIDAQREVKARKAAKALLDGINPPEFSIKTLEG